MLKKFLPLIYIGIVVLFLAFSIFTRPEPEIIVPLADVPDFGMTFPANYQEDFVLYLVVDRVDNTVRHIYVHPDAITALETGDELPYGTQIVIETYDAQVDLIGNTRRDEDGHLIAGELRPNIHVMEKRANWTTEQLPSPVGVIDWNFGSFDAQTFLPSDENRNDCLTCHDGGAFRRDFVFSRSILENYIASGEVQFLYCSLPRRANCIR